FLGWFVLAAWGSRNALGSARLWLHVAACVPLLTTFYYGYDGPCPPWNDALIHRYQFALHALDVERLPLEGRFTGAQALAAMHGHVLARATVTCSYTLNPRLAGPVPPAA
ncbi:MAG TPA: YbhB/YbcL family Raf kinase inhibitor-like protein, partial [Burkholderiaceae bacterium]|nr:YbhB/YbcL family Raf kinase inhibitor-like protein [Burkholderiaceae bacterium]